MGTGELYDIIFDGIYRDDQFWINSLYLDRHQSGYNECRIDVTDLLVYGNENPNGNVLAVRIDARQCEGWFYEGGGIYRHVWLEKTDPVAIEERGTYIRTRKAVGKGASRRAELELRTCLRNDSAEPVKVDVLCSVLDGNGKARAKTAAKYLDVQGCNYRVHKFDWFHKEYPNTPLIGTENSLRHTTHGVYRHDPDKGYVDSYDRPDDSFFVNRIPAEEMWRQIMARDFVAGAFVWTGIDYKGEPKPYGWPAVSSHFGMLDSCCFPKDVAYYQPGVVGAHAYRDGKRIPHDQNSQGAGQEVSLDSKKSIFGLAPPEHKLSLSQNRWRMVIIRIFCLHMRLMPSKLYSR